MPIHGYPGNVITANPTAPTSSVASGVWTTEQQLQAVSQGNWPGYEYPISRSLRFNSADSAYLNRTAGSPTNQIKWTFSGWIKRSTFGAYSTILSGGSTVNDYSWYGFDNNDKFAILHVIGGTNQSDNNSASTMVFRDPSAWYHIVIVYDSANATSANRTILYVNGVQQTISALPSLNEASSVNANGITQYIAQRGYSAIYNNGYMTELNFIDGQALDPSSFGLNDPETGVWSPKRYTGTYGTNGFYLNFSDNSGTTSTTLGKDSSGNGNNWTPNNFSVTAGAGNDSLVDSPTSYGTDTGVGGEVRGNYATLNPIEAPSASVISNGNLQVVLAATGANQTPSTIGVTSGKWYSEFTFSATASGNAVAVGVGPANAYQANIFNVGVAYNAFDGEKYVLGVNAPYGATWTTGDIIGIALDVDGGTITFYKNNTSQGAITLPASASGWKFGIINGGGSSTKTIIANFGQRAFAYTAPSGFKALCTQNLPTPTIGTTSTTQANDYFNVLLYTGTGATQNITGLDFQPDWVWIKIRNQAYSHNEYDAVRGANKRLRPNQTGAEATVTDQLMSFNSNGFTLGADSGEEVNSNGNTFVAWNWKANGAGSTNTAGTITSTVSANTTSGFSIVTYTGNGTAGATFGHGLGVAPSMVIVKQRNASTIWIVGHISLTWNSYLRLNETSAIETSVLAWNNTSPTSTVVSLGSSSVMNGNTNTYVAYCFAPVAGYSAFGSFTGNGSADGPFVYLGFRPAFVMAKLSSATGDWNMVDDMRQTYNDASGNPVLRANLSSAEEDVDTMQGQMDLLSNGFKLRSNNSSLNLNGGTIIYAAFAENPFKYSLAR